MERKIFWDAAIAIPLATGLLYVMGASYRNAYLWSLGISGRELQTSFEILLFDGFLTGMGAAAGGFAIVILIVYCVIAVLIAIAALLASTWVSKLTSKWIARGLRYLPKRNALGKNELPEASEKIFAFVERISSVVAIASFAFIAILLVGVLSEKRGRDAAEKMIAETSKSKNLWREIRLENGKRIRLGPVIECDEHQCAYMARDRALLLKRSLIVAQTASPLRTTAKL